MKLLSYDITFKSIPRYSDEKYSEIIKNEKGIINIDNLLNIRCSGEEEDAVFYIDIIMRDKDTICFYSPDKNQIDFLYNLFYQKIFLECGCNQNAHIYYNYKDFPLVSTNT